MNRIVLKNPRLIHSNGDIAEVMYIVIEDGKIKAFDSDFRSDDEVMDCTGKYISPSLVNLHTHSPMNMFKGFAEDVTIDRWFNELIWPYEKKLVPEDAYHGSRVAIAEMQNNGVTAFADHYMFAEYIARAAVEMDMNADIAPTLFSVDGSFREGLEQTIDLYKRYKDIDRIVVSLGPHSPYTCTMEDLVEMVNVQSRFGFKVHIHAAETKEQVLRSRKEKGETPFEFLSRAGVLMGRTIIAHGLYVEEGDLLFLNNNTTFALSPKTYFKLNMGFGNAPFLKNRIKIGIGTDGAASSNTLNPLEQARLLALMGKYLYKESNAFPIKEIWGYLMEGHRALEFNSGELREGFAADLIIWDLNKPSTAVSSNPLASIIYSADSENVEAVMTKGVFVKKDGRLLHNVSASILYLNERMKELGQSLGADTSLKY
jgi:5-methylthioadenosine/S-adenosylhomocysteine deaminase